MSTAVDVRPGRTLPSLARGRVPFVLISGGKGGVGKSLVTANLGIELARRGMRVLLVDLDLGLANLNVLLRVSTARNVEDALAGRCTLAECVTDGPGGVHVLPASSGSNAMGRPDDDRNARLFTLLGELATQYDVVLGDGAAGIGPDVLAFAAAADRVLVVTTPEPTALTDAYGLIKALHTFGEESGREVPTPELVVNRAASLEEALSTAAKLRGACERFLARSPKSAGWLPLCAVVARSAGSQRPFALDQGALDRGGTLARTCLAQLGARVARWTHVPGVSAVPQGSVGHGR
jgi:flagellar biosynthesis protein FlhG